MAYVERVAELSGHLFDVHFARYEFAAPYCAGANVLDIACGTGYGSDLLRRTARGVVAIDVSDEGPQLGRERFRARNLHFLVGSGTAIPLRSGTADVTVSFETIEHVEDYRGMLAELRRVTRAGGTLVLSTPNKTVSDLVRLAPNPFHVKEFTPEEFRALLGEFFEGAEIRLFAQQPYAPATGALARFSPLLKRAVSLVVAADRWNLRRVVAGGAVGRMAVRCVDELSLDTHVYPADEMTAPALIQLAVIKT